MIETSGGDTDMVDGYDTLPPEMQEKVKFALENGHVPDEDWKGVSVATCTCIPSSANNLQDVEVNRPGKKGFRYKAPKEKATKKKGKKADEDDDIEESPKSKTKRGRAAKDDDGEEDAPAPKKAKGRVKKAAVKDEGVADAEEDEPKPAKAKGRGKKAAVNVASEEVDEAELETKAEEKAEENAEDDEPKLKKTVKGKKAAVKKEAAPRPASSRAQRTTSKAAPVYNDDAINGEDDDEKPAPQKR